MKSTHSRLSQRWLLIFYVLASLILACSLGSDVTPDTRGDQVIPLDTGDTSVTNRISTTETGEQETSRISIRLSDGQAQPQAAVPLTVLTGEPLTPEEIAAIQARLPELESDAADQADFRLPEEILPPPLTGETIAETFPLDEELAPETVVSGPLEVLRYAPEGEIPIAPFVNVTFNQPMVPLTTIEDLALEESPVKISPEIPGTWRWLGTKTLNFQFDSDLIDRLPMATEYTVSIPAGTESATGSQLAESVEFSFSPPPPTVQQPSPYSHDPQPLDPIFFISFDQRIDPAAVLETIQVTADGKEVAVNLISAEIAGKDKAVQRLIDNAGESRWLVFQASESLPQDTNIYVQIGPGTPSAEGPVVTTDSQGYGFQTYAPLKIDDHGCTWWDDKCPPLTPFFIRFNNPIDTDFYQEEWLTIEPELPGAVVNLFGDTINIRGASEGQTTYKVTINGDIQDVFGQTLGKTETLKIRVDSAEPFLVGPQSALVTLDPAASDPALSLYVMNYNKLDLQIYQVEPADWPAFKKYMQEYSYTDQPLSPPGKKVLDETKRLETPTDKLTEIRIELKDYLTEGRGHFLVMAQPPKGLFTEERYWEHVNVWVQVTQIGLDAFVDHTEMVAWANALQDGRPLSEIAIESDSGEKLGTTAASGVARFPIPSGGTTYLVARQGSDVAFLPSSNSFWDEGGWSSRHVSDELRWYVFDDRQMYKPGEEVHLKGWIRAVGGQQDGDVGLLDPSVLTGVSYRVTGPQGNEIAVDQVAVNALGGFDLAFAIPENTNLGYAYIEFSAEGITGGFDGRWYSHDFQIQEFRRPEFEVVARNETVGPYFVGDSATVAVEAKYFAGGPLPNAETTWWVSGTPTNYTPPNWNDFSFGFWTPWWWYWRGDDSGDSTSETYTGQTDATGNHYLQLDFDSGQGLRPFSVLAEATVMDVNRQAWTGSTSLMVHPANLYVGLRSERYFVERGDPLKVDLIVTDLDGEPVADRQIEVSAARLAWKLVDGSWDEVAVETQECTIGSQSEPVTCTFETPIGGRYRISALITDELGRQNESRIIRWVSGGDLPPSRKVEKEEVTLIPDQEHYQPGDAAKILVQAPFTPAEGLLTVSRSGILYTERFEIEDGSLTLEIPIESEHIPNLNIQVDLIGSAPRTDDQGEPLEGVPDRPAYASGTLVLNIPPLERTLDLTVEPRDTRLEPGGETTVLVTLTDANGNPVPNAELAAVVVDEAILALTGYQLADPVSVFYRERGSWVGSYYSRANIVLVDPTSLAATTENARSMAESKEMPMEEAEGEVMMEMAAAPMAEADMAFDDAAGAAAGGSQPIAVRADFNPLATFAPETRTDANGQARIEVKLPDNLTRYRIMVVAVDEGGNQFGSGESNLTARLPLMVRPSAPRFLNFGDNFEFPIVLQNQTDEALTTEVIINTTNLDLTGAAGLRIEVPANDRVEVRFPAGTDMAGTARFQIAAVSGDYADAASGEMPVYTPATTEAFATYGVVDEGAIVQPIGSPSDVFSQFGGLEIQTSSTALQALTDAVIYLVSYPYECTEQLASRVLGVAALRDVLTAFEAEGLPDAEAMEAAVNRDIDKLQAMQNWDGGFPYWRRGQESIPFNTIHVAQALQRAQLKGFSVPAEMQQNVLYYLQDIESHYPHWYSQRTRWTLSSYALFVRNMMGDRDVAKALNLFNEAGTEGLSLDALGWLWAVLVDDPSASKTLDEIRLYVANRVVETAGAANFTTAYDDQTYLLLSSNRRTDAILLDVLIADDPNSDLIPKLVTGLLAHRKQGRWYNTQENVFVLLALDRYFNTFEAKTPDFVARIWLGDTYAGEHTYTGRTTERHETEVPMVYLTEADYGGGQEQDLVISKDGPGRLYYRLGLKYAPTDLWLDPLDMGFVVTREYEAVDDPEDVYRAEDGVWHLKAGARVRVRLTMVADNRRYHVALVDPLPAGLEIVNPALAVSGSLPQDPNSSDYSRGWWWWGTWYGHQNLRDERAEAFTTLLWDGVYEYTYVARATTPGTFVVPPSKAEEMYSPEVFGRSASDWVIVE